MSNQITENKAEYLEKKIRDEFSFDKSLKDVFIGTKRNGSIMFVLVDFKRKIITSQHIEYLENTGVKLSSISVKKGIITLHADYID